MDSEGIQPYYAAYARTRSLPPMAVFDADGGTNWPYMEWIRGQWREWMSEAGRSLPLSDADRAAFRAWLETRHA